MGGLCRQVPVRSRRFWLGLKRMGRVPPRAETAGSRPLQRAACGVEGEVLRDPQRQGRVCACWAGSQGEGSGQVGARAGRTLGCEPGRLLAVEQGGGQACWGESVVWGAYSLRNHCRRVGAGHADGGPGGWSAGGQALHRRPQLPTHSGCWQVPSCRGGPEVGESGAAGPGWGWPVPFLSPRMTRICSGQACPFSHTFD